MADSAVPSRVLSDRTAFDRDLSSETANFMGYDSPHVSSHPTKSSPAAPQTTTSRQHLFAAGNTQKRPATRGRVERLVVCWPPLTSSAEDPPVVPKP
jgi:hypothetical protein